MLRWILGLFGNAVALWVATLVVPGITLQRAHGVYAPDSGGDGDQYTVATLGALLAVALVFMLVNAIIKPLVEVISLPFTILSLGLFLFVINALMLWLTGWASEQIRPFGSELLVDGFWAAFWGGIVVGLVNWVLGVLLPERRRG